MACRDEANVKEVAKDRPIGATRIHSTRPSPGEGYEHPATCGCVECYTASRGGTDD